MLPEPRAVIFDLDNTLYPLEWFVTSGFRAVAECLAVAARVDAHEAFTVLSQARASGQRGHELQICLEHFGLPIAMAPALLKVFRGHTPTLELPVASRTALEALRDGWRLGVVTNGAPDIQARKVRALGLRTLVETIVFADQCGTGIGKPEPEAFFEAAARLNVRPDRAVFVGDDRRCDIVGAKRVGMQTIHLAPVDADRAPDFDSTPDATVRSLFEVPEAAERLLSCWSPHAA